VICCQTSVVEHPRASRQIESGMENSRNESIRIQFQPTCSVRAPFCTERTRRDHGQISTSRLSASAASASSDWNETMIHDPV